MRAVKGADTAPSDPDRSRAAPASAAVRLGVAGYANLLRGCGAAGVSGGLLFVVWGYVDGPEFPRLLTFAVRAFAFVVPVLFAVAIVGLCVSWEDGAGRLGWLAIAIAGYASCLGLVEAGVGGGPMWAYFDQRGWPHYLGGWLTFMLVGLSLAGVGAMRSGSARSGRPLALTTCVCGWAYYLTDSGAVLESRWAHVGFGLLFGLGWLVLGAGLFLAAGTRRAKGSQGPA